MLTAVLFLMGGSGCYKKISIPEADFTFHGSNDTVVPDTVTFTNLSQNAGSYEWNFGDSQTSTETNPIHIYTAAGSYSVSLKAYATKGDQWSTKSHVVSVK